MDPFRSNVKLRLNALEANGVHWVSPRESSVVWEDTEDRGAETPAVEVPDQRMVALATLKDDVAKCRKCPELFSTRTQTVFGVGPLSPELCVVGEAPGADEDEKGEPFVGRAGQLLDKILAACGFQRSEVYICNTLKCRPPNNRTPLPAECENCKPFFEAQLELIQPKFICCVGSVAGQNLLSTKDSCGKMRGKMHQYKGIPVLVTYHPAYLLRNPAAKADVWEDMKFLLRQMGRPIPDHKKQNPG
jgi:DNA polymerase